MTLDIVIPSKTERFLFKTTKDVLSKTSSATTIYVVLDGYELPKDEVVEDARVKYIHFPETTHAKKRQAINLVAKEGKGDHIMSLDAHCMIAEGFDEQLFSDHNPNWVQVPRRNRLDPENWCIQSQVDKRPPIDYEYTMWPLQFDPPSFHGFKWDERTLSRADIPIDDTMHFQGSCWFMTKDWFYEMELMDLAYQGWGQEAEEIALKTWSRGGYVKTNKNTWYAHLHKGPKYGRMYHLSLKETRDSSAYAYDYWMNGHKEFMINFFKKFWPIPGWPLDWEDKLWEKKSQ